MLSILYKFLDYKKYILTIDIVRCDCYLQLVARVPGYRQNLHNILESSVTIKYFPYGFDYG